MADGSGGALTGVLVYLHLVATGVTAVDNNGDGGGQQRYIGGHGSVDGSGGGNISGGNDNDGYTLVAGGIGPPPNWAVEEQQDGGDYAEDDSGPLAGTFGTSRDFSAGDSINFPTLGPGLQVLARSQRQ